MFAANSYRIRFATPDDADTLNGLAERESQQPLVGRVLIGQLDGTPAAALSIHDGRVIADSSRRTGALTATLRMRASGIRAFEATPSLAERIRAGYASYNGGSNVVPAPMSRDVRAEDEPTRIAA
jgi:hypothetical protein